MGISDLILLTSICSTNLKKKKRMADAKDYRWSGKRILVVEDDESSTFFLGEMLKHTGAIIEFRSDGEEAVEYVRDHPDTDLILMDLHLPVKDGFTASREIKTFAHDVKIIAQTGYAYSVDRDEAEKAGCDDYLIKPVNQKRLLETLNRYFS